MVMGMFHNEGMGLQFSNRRHLYRCPEKVLWDAQHSIWASGGIAQYEINQLLQQAMRDGVGMPNIQAFLRTVHLPGRPHCTLNLSQRIAPGQNTHMRAYASDMLELVEICVALGDMVLEPGGMMAGHVFCLRLLHSIQCIILRGDEACRLADRLDDLLDAHHQMYLALYPTCLKPKLQYMRSLAVQYRKFQAVQTCFSSERHHRQSKAIAAHSFKNIGKTLIRRRTMHTLYDLRDPEAFQCNRLGTESTRWSNRSRWLVLLRNHALRGCARSASLRSQCGWLKQGAFVLYAAAANDGTWHGGIASDFWRATADGASMVHVVIIRRCELVTPEATATSWMFRPHWDYVVVNHERMLGAAAWVPDGVMYRVILPLYARDIFGEPARRPAG